MKKKSLFLLILSIVCVFALFAFAACSDGDDKDGDTATTYTVTFDANGGTFADSKTTATATTDNSGKVALPTTNPTRTDYTFDGYNTKADGTGTAVTAATVYTADTTVYAKWTASGTNPSDNTGSTDIYYFEAEYTDLTGLSSDIGSGTAYDKSMIQKDSGAHNGQYVSQFNGAGQSLTFKITAEEATTADLSILLTLVSEATVDPEYLIVKVNNVSVSFTATKITPTTEKVSAIETKIVFTQLEIGEISLVQGENTITLTVGTKANASGSGSSKLNFHFDALVIESSVKLTWNPIDPDTYYPDF